MPRGPSPKPTALRLIDGDRKDRINTEEPIPLDRLPEAPPYMSGPVRDIWDYTVRELRHMRLAKACDRDSLVAYCEAVVAHRQACQLLAKTAVLVTSSDGRPVRNPAFAIMRDSANMIRVFAQEFGLTPSARSRIRATEEEANLSDNPFASSGSA